MKYIFLIFFNFITLLSIGQIKTSGIFETGYENRRTIIYLPTDLAQFGIFPYYDLKPYYALLYLDIEYKGIKVYAFDKTYFNKAESIYFNPLLTEYTLGASYTYKKCTWGYEHMCSHSISMRVFSESYDRIYFRIILF